MPLIAAASRRIQRDAPIGQQPDLLTILQAFAEGRYTANQLAQVIPEEVAMASGLFERAELKGRTEGLAEGRAEEARRICVDLVKALHPAVAVRVRPLIEGCADLTRLRRWALRAPRVSDEELVRLVTGRASVRSSRRRAPRPARSAKVSRSR